LTLATSITVNAATLNRPGVFIAQSATGGLPQPIATHAVGYLFGTTPADEYYGSDSEGVYSSFLPYTPTQVASAQDFLSRIGGSTPSASRGALTTYDSVKAFFDNVGVNGILYFTRVTPTPETVIDLAASSAGAGYNAFALKVNGRYFGTPIGVPDDEQVEIKVIVTTGIDKIDNARDLYEYLSSSNSDGFSDFYRVEQTSDEALAGKFRIFSRDNTQLPRVDEFVAYNISDTAYASPVELNTVDVVKVYTSVKEVNFRCNSRDVASGEKILFVDGSAVSQFVADANAETPDTYDMTDADDKSAALEDFLADQGIYTSVPNGKIVAVSKDFTSGVGSGDKWPDADAAYWVYSTSTGKFTKLVSGLNAVVPTGTVPTSGPRTGYLPDSVQVFYVSIAGENRALIVNGATPDELAQGLRDEIINVLAEKDLAQYYDVEAVPTGSNYTGTSYAPNNGYKVIDNLLSTHGSPFIRPDIDDAKLSGTVAIAAGAVTGTNTLFTQEVGAGSVIVVNGIRFTVTTVTSDTALVVTPANVTVTAGASAFLDKSLANGFFAHDYVLRVRITAKNGIVSPVLPGTNRQGLIDENVVKLTSIVENIGYAGYKLTAQGKAQDFVYAIEKGMSGNYYAPGFLLAPEAYSELSYEAGSDLASRSEAASERLKITQTLVAAAEGRFGTTEGITNTQHMALIDCGGDVENLAQAQDELGLIKRVVGVPYGHGAYFAPYLKNTDDRFVPPSGYVAGIACSRYINEGFQQPPAGSRYPLRGVTDVKFNITAQQQEVTYALGLNPIRSLPNRGIVVWGSRTLSSSSLFRFVNTRVVLNALIDVMNRSFDDVLFESIDSAGTIYSRVSSIATQILNQFYNQGALFGSQPEQAYLVVCGDSNNSPELLEQGTVRMDAYVATSPTLERLAVTIVRTPIGQVSLLSDSFSRNGERFAAFLSATNLNA
jgi:uncharacterized protein